jgi:Protein of unknown function (DUF1064)
MTYFVRKGNKYNNTPQLYNGNRYDSKKESSFAQQLDLRKKAKDIKDWERQIKLDLRVLGKHVCYWTIDFKIIHNDGSIEWLETKGFETRDYLIKRRLFEILKDEMYPGSILTIIK